MLQTYLDLADRIEAGEKIESEEVFAKVSGWDYPLYGSAIGSYRDQDRPDYLRSVDAAVKLVEAVQFKLERPVNLCIAAAYGRAYIVPSDGRSYGIHDPAKVEASIPGEGVTLDRMARSITVAALRALAK